jgi:hypothetical protein
MLNFVHSQILKILIQTIVLFWQFSPILKILLLKIGC